MRVITALCSAIYAGRGNTTLGEAVRAIIIKDDGSISLHNDVSNKPLNYMGSGCIFSESVQEDSSVVWVFDGRKENLQIFITEIFTDIDIPLDKGIVGLERDGTENHLQEWLSENLHVFGDQYTFGGREVPTGAGPVDILLFNGENPVAVEVKRVATPNAVYQALRYVDALKESYEDVNVTGMVAALDLRPAMVALAAKRGVQVLQIPNDWRGLV